MKYFCKCKFKNFLLTKSSTRYTTRAGDIQRGRERHIERERARREHGQEQEHQDKEREGPLEQMRNRQDDRGRRALQGRGRELQETCVVAQLARELFV